MKLVKVAAAVLNQTPLDWEGNKTRMLGAIEAARAQGVSVLCLPELCVSGYGCEDAFHSRGLHRIAWEVLEEVLPATRGMVVSAGLPVDYAGSVYNAACLAVDGRLLGLVAKRHLAGEGIHYEPRWFEPWPAGCRAELRVNGERYPLGDLIFDVGGVRIGFEICEDAWVAKRRGGDLALEGVDIILNPSASHFAFGKQEIRKRYVLEGSRAFGVSYVYANLLGNESGRAIYDGGTLIASAGRMLAMGPRFSFADVGLTTAVVDVDVTRLTRARSGGVQAVQGEQASCLHAELTWPELEPLAQQPDEPAWERGERVKHEELTRAVALGLFDYMRKSCSRGFVVSLSGGADSAAVACLVAVMAELAMAELGREGVRRKLAYAGELEDASARDLVRSLLVCVYQATRNSSEVTREAARRVAEAVGAEFHHFEVDGLVDAYVDMVSEALGRKLGWETDDVALQNIQSRARAPGVWLLANLRNALLVATSNRSEAAVGYATMDGDTCGGLSPIAGIDKAFLREWLRWMEETGPAGLDPLPALEAVNSQQPTAELRPPGAAQTDEGDLMPYDVLDAIERAAIRDKQTPLEAFRTLRTRHAHHGDEQLAAWVERFFRLWARNQWKRERYAPSFHLDDQNLDPRSWCRFPILSGGFERELARLRAYVAGS